MQLVVRQVTGLKQFNFFRPCLPYKAYAANGAEVSFSLKEPEYQALRDSLSSLPSLPHDIEAAQSYEIDFDALGIKYLVVLC